MNSNVNLNSNVNVNVNLNVTLSTRPKVFRDFSWEDNSHKPRMDADESAVCVHLRPSAAHNGKVVPHMQTPENIWPGTYT